jgi:tetratricopeptide (TPR) repeat protein
MKTYLALLIGLHLLLHPSAIFSQQPVSKSYQEAIVAIRSGRFVEAQEFFRRALKEAEKSGDQEQVAISLDGLGVVAQLMNKYDQAKEFYQREIEIYTALRGPEDYKVAFAKRQLGNNYISARKYADAESVLKQALAIGEKAKGPEHMIVALLTSDLGELFSKQKKYDEAETFYKRSLIVFEKNLGPESPTLARKLENYAMVLKKMNRKGEAAEMEARAKKIYEKSGKDTSFKLEP